MKNNSGMTFIEILITLSIIGLLAGLAIPDLIGLINKTVADTTVRKIYRLYQLGRTVAVKEGIDIQICGSNDGKTCDRQWHNYLIVYQDVNENTQPDPEETIYHGNLNLKRGYVKTRFAFGKSSVTLTPDGTASITGSMIYCPKTKNPNHYHRVTWSRMGRPYLGVDHNNDGAIDDRDGAPLSCQ